MSDKKMDIPENMQSSLIPEMLSLDSKIKFNCHKDISCYNKCCKQADITLTAYDVVRMKQHFGIDSSEFLNNYTVPFEMDAHGTPGIKMRTDNEGVCIHMREEGCSIYENRPSACRYYGMGVMSRRDQGSTEDYYVYFRNKEDICKGWEEDYETTVGEYREDQGLVDYDKYNREWMQLILKKKSAGYSIGKPSEMSMQLFFMASFDIDRFKRFVTSPAFNKVYLMKPEEIEQVTSDDIALMEFGYVFMRHVLFGEESLPMDENAYEKRYEERKEIIEMRRDVEVKEHQRKQEELKKEALRVDDERLDDGHNADSCAADDSCKK
jgi:Fe-S-cluster containining protein